MGEGSGIDTVVAWVHPWPGNFLMLQVWQKKKVLEKSNNVEKCIVSHMSYLDFAVEGSYIILLDILHPILLNRRKQK